MRWGKLSLAAAGVAVVALMGIGATSAGATTVTDPKGDSSTDVDIKSVAINPNPTGTDLVVKITYWKKAAPGGRACFELRAGKHSSAKDFWLLGCNSPNGNKAFGGKTTIAIKAKLTRTSATYTFDPAKFGATNSFRWRAVVTEEDKIVDAAPNHGWTTYNG